jgi:CMP-N-acetylneuraminic acid synthetase
MFRGSRIVGMVPSRLGSRRIKFKGLRLIKGKPLIYYPIREGIKSRYIDEVYINSESDIIGEVGKSYGARFYRRKEEYASDKATSDSFVYDFLKNNKMDVLVLLNPTAPLIRSSDVDRGIEFFFKNSLDSLHTVSDIRSQAIFRGKPINFEENRPWINSQDIVPVKYFVFSFMIWKRETFMRAFEKNGSGYVSGKVGYFPLDPLRAVDVDYEEDFRIAEILMGTGPAKPRYHQIVYEKKLVEKP